jgi:Mg2+ and Co2+ transporter CorA
MTQFQNKFKKDLKERVENRLQRIKKEVEVLLQAIKGKEYEELSEIAQFEHKIHSTMESANNLQYVLTQIKRDSSNTPIK